MAERTVLLDATQAVIEAHTEPLIPPQHLERREGAR